MSNRSGSWEVWLAASDESSQTQLTQLNGPVVGIPRWSPDGSRIAVQVQTPAGADIRTIDASSGLVIPLTEHAGDDVAPSWSPTGKQVYFGSNRTGSWQIWVIPAAGGEAMQLTDDGGYAAHPSRDGRFLFVSKDDSAGLWRMDLESGVTRRILDDPARGDWGNWAVSDDGIYILRRHPTDSPPTLVLVGFDGSEARDIVTLDPPPTPHHPGLALAPDGRSVLITLVDDTESDLFVMSLGSE